MPTPASGQISMNDMRTHINRATTSAISMSEMRTRYGGSGQINFSDLYDSEGFTVTCATYVAKFFSFDGWYKVFSFGSVSPNENDGTVQFAANSFLIGAYSSPAGTGTSAAFIFADSTTAYGSNTTIGYRGLDVTRAVTANVNRSITSSSNTDAAFSYDFPASGTIHCLIKF